MHQVISSPAAFTVTFAEAVVGLAWLRDGELSDGGDHPGRRF
jgi:hypothetical protein